MEKDYILLVEDNPDDEALILRSFRNNEIMNEVVVVRDGAEALEFLFATGQYAERDPAELPQFILLNLNLPKVGGLEVLRHVRADERTRLIPLVILTASDDEQNLIEGYGLRVNGYVRKAVVFTEFANALRQLGLYWTILNEPPPPPPA
jgi:two-component system response regulator